MDIQTALDNITIRIAQEFNSIRTLINGNLPSLINLTTANKTNLVAAINEINSIITNASSIDDATIALSTTWSSSKIIDYVNTKISDLLGGVNSAYDTLLELQIAINANSTSIANITSSLLVYPRFDAPQTLTLVEKNQICNNIGVGNTDTDFSTAYLNALV